jgi:hypothetical protein
MQLYVDKKAPQSEVVMLVGRARFELVTKKMNLAANKPPIFSCKNAPKGENPSLPSNLYG